MRRVTSSRFGQGTPALIHPPALSRPFRDWLAKLRAGDDPQQRRAGWQERAHRLIGRLADQLLAEAGDAAWEGRVIQTRAGQEEKRKQFHITIVIQ